MTVHSEPHPLAGGTVPLVMGGAQFRVEDWWDRVYGAAWTSAADEGNPAAIAYAVRVDATSLPLDDEVLYGKVGGYGVLVHVDELRPAPGDRTEPEPAR